MAVPSYRVFITGASGFIGRALAARLVARGHLVRALVRSGSSWTPPEGVVAIMGDPLNASTFAALVPPCDTFVQLVGVAHPNPSKARRFFEVDLAAAKAGIAAATAAGARHFVYLSVAQPAPVMRAYVEARAQAEAALRDSRLDATVLRPWYVLGPGRRWPLILTPVYRLAEWLPPTRDIARRLGMVTIEEMIAALVDAVEHPARGHRVLDVPAIRAIARRDNP